jgi:hypothetical protein
MWPAFRSVPYGKFSQLPHCASPANSGFFPHVEQDHEALVVERVIGLLRFRRQDVRLGFVDQFLI